MVAAAATAAGRSGALPHKSLPNSFIIPYWDAASSQHMERPTTMRTRDDKVPARKVLRSIHEGARDMARDIARSDDGQTSRRQRRKVEMLFAHLKRILKLGRLRLRGPDGARNEFHLAATAHNLGKLAKVLPMPELKPA